MNLYVPIRDERAAERLRVIAREQRRRPQDQAAIILETALLSHATTEQAVAMGEPEREAVDG